MTTIKATYRIGFFERSKEEKSLSIFTRIVFGAPFFTPGVPLHYFAQVTAQTEDLQRDWKVPVKHS